MRRFPIIAMLTALSCLLAFSQIPRKLSYQGLLTDSLGTPKPDNLYNLTFRLYRLASGGTPLWTENRSLQVKRGLFSAVLGDQTPLPDSLKFNAPYWLGLQISGEPELTPRLPLAAVGYSLYSINADTAKYAKAAPQAAFVDSARVAGTTGIPLALIGTDNYWPVMRAVNYGSAVAILGLNGGTGRGGFFQIQNASNSSVALESVTDGTGRAGWFHIENTGNASAAVEGVTNGTGRAGWFHIDNASNSESALRAESNGSGHGVLGRNSGTGRGGMFQIQNAGNASAALEGVTDGTGRAGWFHINNASNSESALRAESNGSGHGVLGRNSGTGRGGLFQIQNAGNASAALEGVTDGTGRAAYFHIENSANTDHAVEATTNSNYGGSAIYGNASTTTGYADGVTGMAHAYSSVGGRFSNDGTGPALMASGLGDGADRATMIIHNNSSTYGMAAKITNLSGYHTMHIQNTGSGGVLYLQNNGDGNGTGGNDFISAFSSTLDAQFKVLSNGEVRSDAGFFTPAADFAEMLPAADGLEPADVLVIGEDGTLILSSQPYQSNVAGVYSTRPGFTGGKPVEGQIAGTIPLAISGIVPAKVTDENGPITPGDLLVTSSTPGYAMKAERNPVQGSVIGKALEKLEQGKGRIRILAILQ